MSRFVVFCYFLAVTANIRTVISTEDEDLHLKDNPKKILRASSLDKNSDILDLSKQNFSEIEDGAFSGMKNLESLNLKHNQLEEFRPGFLGDCRHLDSFFASHNKIRVIKSHTFSTSLHKIDLSHNEISEIEENSFPQIWWLSVDVSHNRLTNLRDYTFSRFFSNINSFNASHNRIRTIERDALRHAPYFDKLDLSYNEISDLKNGSVCGIDSLTHLYVSHNHLTGEDLTVLVGCTKLEFLDISHNKIKHLEENQFKNTTLQDIDLSGNEILKLDLSIFSDRFCRLWLLLHHNSIKVVRGGNSSVTNLDLSYNKIETIESKTFKDMHLSIADLTNNEITSIGNEVFNHALWELQLQHNKLKSFSNWFVSYPDLNLGSIERINVSHNEIERVETGALNNYKVRELDLSYNKISTIAANAFNSTILERLYLDHNSLTVLKENVFNCSELYFLDISFNKIKTLEPAVFRDLNRLGYLDLSHNEIETLDLGCIGGGYLFRIILHHNDRINKATVEEFLCGFLNCDLKPNLAVNATLDQQSCQYFNMKNYNDRFIQKKQAYSIRTKTENNNECVIDVKVV